MRIRRGGEPYAAHLIGGHTHPDARVAVAASEFKNGARTADTMSVKLQQLVFLRLAMENELEAKEDELREEDRKANARR